jgi:hypothetical protein
MKRFLLEKSKRDVLTSHSGLALVGLCLNRHSDLPARADEHLACQGIRSADVIRSYVGLLCLGQNDFEAVTGRRKDRTFRKALGIGSVPSAETLRQRLDQMPEPFRFAVADAATELIGRAKAPVSALSTGHVALDCDVTPLDNSGTHKEGVSYTYKGHDGYAPMGAYLGQEGWCLELELRPGSQHAQNDFVPFLHRVLYRAQRLVGPTRRLLVRLDSAHDAAQTRWELSQAEKTDWIVKWNPRKQDLEAWWQRALSCGAVTEDPKRPGKRTAILDETITGEYEGNSLSCRRIVRLVERTIDRRGQPLLLPDRELEGWWTDLGLEPQKIIKLYNDHGTSEQFHSELKTDLDIERLPSGKFATNALVLALAGLAYNILRLIGQIGLLGEFSPVRHPVKRRRLKTVMQELMYVAARVIHSGRRLRLRFAEHCPGFEAFRVVYHHLSTA